MEIYKCDRCGEIVEEATFYDEQVITKQFEGQGTESVHLCYPCELQLHAALKEWVKGSETKKRKAWKGTVHAGSD